MNAQSQTLAVIGVSYPFRGGIAHYSTCLVKHLRKRYVVDFITFTRQYPDFLFPGKTQLDESANPIRESNQPLIDSINPFSWWRTARALRSRDPALIVFNWWHPFFGLCYGAIVQLLPRALRNRVCFLCHNVLPHERTRLERLLSAFAFRHVRRFIVHSEEDKQTLLKLKPDAQALRNCHPVFAQFAGTQPIDKAAARAQLKLPPERNVVLFFGLIRPYKGLALLIEAMPEVLRAIDCSLLVAGEFYDDKSKYTALIDRLELRARVRIEDAYIPNEDVHRYFAAADVVVLPYIEASQSGNRADCLQLQYAGDFHARGRIARSRTRGQDRSARRGRRPGGSGPGDRALLSARLWSRFRAGIAQYVDRFGCEEEARSIEQFMQAAGAGA